MRKSFLVGAGIAILACVALAAPLDPIDDVTSTTSLEATAPPVLEIATIIDSAAVRHVASASDDVSYPKDVARPEVRAGGCDSRMADFELSMVNVRLMDTPIAATLDTGESVLIEPTHVLFEVKDGEDHQTMRLRSSRWKIVESGRFSGAVPGVGRSGPQVFRL